MMDKKGALTTEELGKIILAVFILIVLLAIIAMFALPKLREIISTVFGGPSV